MTRAQPTYHFEIYHYRKSFQGNAKLHPRLRSRWDFFFTVNLLERRRCLLTDYLDDLRSVFAEARRRRPFTIDAIVVLPDHLHAV